MIQTLAELKALPQQKIAEMWADAEFPFDAARCLNCISLHHLEFSGHCDEHPDFSREASRYNWREMSNPKGEVLEAMWAMRKLFADLYEIPFPPEPLPQAERGADCPPQSETAPQEVSR